MLMKNGPNFSLEEVAQQAMVSRATAYRYFSDLDALKLEASLDIKTKTPEQLFQQQEEAPAAARLQIIQSHLFELAKTNEAGFRTYLSAVLKMTADNNHQLIKVRGARRLPMIEAALEPYKAQLDEKTYFNLVHSMAVLVGIESYLVLKDVCGLNYKEASKVMQWSIEKLTNAIVKITL